MYALIVVCVGYSFVSYLFNSWLALQSIFFTEVFLSESDSKGS